MKQRTESQFVYYVDTGMTTSEGERIIKIGRSENILLRLSTHQQWWPYMRLLAVEPGNCSIETRRHIHFKHLHTAGRELFRMDAELERWIESLASEHHEAVASLLHHPSGSTSGRGCQ